MPDPYEYIRHNVYCAVCGQLKENCECYPLDKEDENEIDHYDDEGIYGYDGDSL